jgi:hypothetical protein
MINLQSLADLRKRLGQRSGGEHGKFAGRTLPFLREASVGKYQQQGQ